MKQFVSFSLCRSTGIKLVPWSKLRLSKHQQGLKERLVGTAAVDTLNVEANGRNPLPDSRNNPLLSVSRSYLFIGGMRANSCVDSPVFRRSFTLLFPRQVFCAGQIRIAAALLTSTLSVGRLLYIKGSSQGAGISAGEGVSDTSCKNFSQTLMTERVMSDK